MGSESSRDVLQHSEIDIVYCLLCPSERNSNMRNCITKLSREIANMARTATRMGEAQVKALWPVYRKLAAAAPAEIIEVERIAQNIIPKREIMGLPVQYHRVPQEEREELCRKSNSIALMWTDGKRDLLEIIRMVEDERGAPVTNVEDYISYFTALAKYGYLEIRQKEDHRNQKH